MDNKLVMISIAAVIGIIVLGSVLMPILDDATATTDTFTNDGLIHMDQLDNSSEYTAYWDYTKPAKLTINGNEEDLPTNAAFALNLFCNDTFFVRWYYAGADGVSTFIEVYKFSDSSGSAVYAARANESKNLAVTISGGTITFDNGGTPLDITFDEMYAISPDGNFVMKNATDTAYLLGDSSIFAHGRSNVAGIAVNTIIEGNITDGFTKDTWPDSLNITVGDTITDDHADVSGFKNLYTLKSLSFEVTNDNTSATGTVTYSQFIVPAEVTAERSVHFTDGQNAIFAAIPVMIILAVLLGVVALVIRSRMD